MGGKLVVLNNQKLVWPKTCKIVTFSALASKHLFGKIMSLLLLWTV